MHYDASQIKLARDWHKRMPFVLPTAAAPFALWLLHDDSVAVVAVEGSGDSECELERNNAAAATTALLPRKIRFLLLISAGAAMVTVSLVNASAAATI